jgi:hypothetical protein
MYPESYILPTEYTKFVRDYSKLEGQPTIYICKPTDMSRGRGIFLIRDLSELTYDQQYIVQRYVDRPLCIGGYKMDLRVYVLVTSFTPLQVRRKKRRKGDKGRRAKREGERGSRSREESEAILWRTRRLGGGGGGIKTLRKNHTKKMCLY